MQAYSPTGVPIVAACERVWTRVPIEMWAWRSGLEWEWGDEGSEVDWDDSVPVRAVWSDGVFKEDPNGEPVFQDENGDLWRKSQLVLEES